ncbi:MAG: hypothetical protein IH986_07210 [Planctomycetes bacterium]|nr:hypothetical protein [Planctomycetota bacterium]
MASAVGGTNSVANRVHDSRPAVLKRWARNQKTTIAHGIRTSARAGVSVVGIPDGMQVRGDIVPIAEVCVWTQFASANVW